MTDKISGTYGTKLVLDPGMPSVLVTGTIKAADYVAVYGTVSADFTIKNKGLIDNALAEHTTYSNPGIFLAAFGKVINQSSILSADGTGVFLYAGGVLNNTGMIIGGEQGIFAADRGAGNNVIKNSGLVEATSKPFGLPGDPASDVSDAISLSGSGKIDNAKSGIITARYGVGVILSGEQNGSAKGTVTAVPASMLNAGTISGQYGVEFTGKGAFSNSGEVSGIFEGVELYADGELENSGQIISQGIGALAYGTTSIVNSGSILSTGTVQATIVTENGATYEDEATGITLLQGGSVSNTSHGVISSADGVGIDSIQGGNVVNAGEIIGKSFGIDGFFPATIINSGTIEATATTLSHAEGPTYGPAGVMTGAGTVINLAHGVITGKYGFWGYGGDDTLVNAGTITGTGGTAVELMQNYDRVVDDPGAVFNGLVHDDLGSGILELAGGGNGSIANFNTAFSGFSTIDVDQGADWTVGGTLAMVLDDGSISLAGTSSLDISVAIDPNSDGMFLLSAKSFLEVAKALGSSTQIAFLAASGTLAIDAAAMFGTKITTPNSAGPILEDFIAGDVIDLRDVADTGLKLGYNAATGNLQVSNSSGGILASLHFQTSSLGSGTFQTASDLVHGTLITLS